jgi:hypothetical protein
VIDDDTNDILSNLISHAARASHYDTNEDFVSNMRHITAGIDEVYRGNSPNTFEKRGVSPSFSSASIAEGGTTRGRKGSSLLSQRKASPMPGYEDPRHGGFDASISPCRVLGPDLLTVDHTAGPHPRSHSAPPRRAPQATEVTNDSPSSELEELSTPTVSNHEVQTPVIKFVEDDDVREIAAVGEQESATTVTISTEDLQNTRRRRSTALISSHLRSQSAHSLDGLSRKRSPSPGKRDPSSHSSSHTLLNDIKRPQSASSLTVTNGRRGFRWTEEKNINEEMGAAEEGTTAADHASKSLRGPPAGMVRDSMLATLNGFEPQANMRLPVVSVFPISYNPLELSERSSLKRERLMAQIVQRQRQAQMQVVKLVDGMQAVLVRDLKATQDAHYNEESKAQAQTRQAALRAGATEAEADEAASAQHGRLHSLNVCERQQRSAEGMLRCTMFLLQRLESLRDLQLYHLEQLYQWDLRFLDKLMQLKLSALEEQLTAELGEGSTGATPDSSSSSLDVQPRARRRSSLRDLLRRKKKTHLTGGNGRGQPETISEDDAKWDATSQVSFNRAERSGARPSAAEARLGGRHLGQADDMSTDRREVIKLAAYAYFDRNVGLLKADVQSQQRRIEDFVEAERTNILQFYLDQGNRIYAMKQGFQSSIRVNALFV